MPKAIAMHHLKRMFPFEFFDEISGKLKEFIFMNPAFFLRDQTSMTHEQQKQLFEEARNTQPIAVLSRNNIIQVEPFGELLALDICCPADDADTVLHDQEKRGQMPLSILVAQLYDSAGLPIFATDVAEETIEQIPEVLWDDPNILLGIVTFAQSGANMAIIKIPPHIEEKTFESIDSDKSADES